MNKTKRKIFETSMKLFAEKGYDSTSIEEITTEVGVAKGTLYYHFSSKEEIFEFLVKEGMELLKNSISVKTKQQKRYIDKIRAIVLIQIKIIIKYENFMSIVLREIWGRTQRSNICQKYVKRGIEKGELIESDPEVLASELFSLACGNLYYKKDNVIDIEKLYKEIDKTFIQFLKK